MTFNNNVATKFPKLAPKGPSGDLLLASERAKGSFDVNELAKFMYTEQWLQKMDKVLQVLESEPAFDKTNRYYLDRKDKIATSLWKDKRLIEVARYQYQGGLEVISYAKCTHFLIENKSGMNSTFKSQTSYSINLLLYVKFHYIHTHSYSLTSLLYSSLFITVCSFLL